MPAREVWCRRDGCGFSTVVHHGVLPFKCEQCLLDGVDEHAKWSLQPQSTVIARAIQPVPYVLTFADRIWLWCFRIMAD